MAAEGTTALPGTIPWAGARVVKASHELSLGQKYVWLEILSLDQGADRCFASASRLSARLGLGLDNLERLRRDLKADGLLATAGSGRRGATWWPELPAQFIPRKRNPTDADVLALSGELDGWLRIRRQATLGNGGESAAIPPPRKAANPPPLPPGKGGESAAISAPASSPASIRDEGEVGGGAPSSQKSVKTSPSSGSLREDGGKAEDGARARAKEEDGAGANAGTANWRQVMKAAETKARQPRVSKS